MFQEKLARILRLCNRTSIENVLDFCVYGKIFSKHIAASPLISSPSLEPVPPVGFPDIEQ